MHQLMVFPDIFNSGTACTNLGPLFKFWGQVKVTKVKANICRCLRLLCFSHSLNCILYSSRAKYRWLQLLFMSYLIFTFIYLPIYIYIHIYIQHIYIFNMCVWLFMCGGDDDVLFQQMGSGSCILCTRGP